jgi:hypothetical protein
VHLSGSRNGTRRMTAARLAALLVRGISDGTVGAMLLMWELGSGYTMAGIGAITFCSSSIPFFWEGFER